MVFRIVRGDGYAGMVVRFSPTWEQANGRAPCGRLAGEKNVTYTRCTIGNFGILADGAVDIAENLNLIRRVMNWASPKAWETHLERGLTV